MHSCIQNTTKNQSIKARLSGSCFAKSLSHLREQIGCGSIVEGNAVHIMVSTQFLSFTKLRITIMARDEH
jgi:hypothetical protein